VYKSTAKEIQDLIKLNPAPGMYSDKVITIDVVKDIEINEQEREPAPTTIDKAPFSDEYSWSGWFKWTPGVMKPWHTVVRMSNIPPDHVQDSKNLGDRTLALFVGTEHGIHQFATYNYENVSGVGNPNVK